MNTTFFKTSLIALVATTTVTNPVSAQSDNVFQNKRELLFSVLDQSKPNAYIPSQFFLHFEKQGTASLEDHVKFYRDTHADYIKVDWRGVKTPHYDVKTIADWKKIPVLDKKIFDDELNLISQLKARVGNETLIIPTVFSPQVFLAEIVGKENSQTFFRLIRENPEALKPALENVTQSIEYFVQEAAKRGADGFYVSSISYFNELGNIFYEVIRPYDKRISVAADKAAPYNILHICDGGSDYVDIDSYVDYPASVINFPAHTKYGRRTLKQVAQLFKRPVYGGLDNGDEGVLAKGSIEEIKAEVDRLLADAPQNIIFAADCTSPDGTTTDKIRQIIDYVHTWRQTHNADGTIKK